MWNVESHKAFEELKNKLSSFPTLTLSDFLKEFIVKCDASKKGRGVVLMQKHKPIAYFSKALALNTLSM